MNDWFPMEAQQSAAQIKEIIALLGDDAKRIVDVGCGDGRILVPLAVAGHEVIGIDVDAKAMRACASSCEQADVDATLLEGNLFDLLPLPEPVDAIVCCGQTFMLLHDVDEAVRALQLFRESLHDGGLVVLDDIPGDLWPEVVHGRWANGVNEEESLQLVWAHNDAVFAIREGEQVDAESWELRDGDQRVRLWTMGAIRMAAQLADLSAPVVPVAGAILVMRAD